jgi:hypothetical protein
MFNDHTDAEFARRETAREMGEESPSDRAWSRFYDAVEAEIVARGWDEAFTNGKSRGLDGADDETGYSIDGAHDAFEARRTVAEYVAQVSARRAALGLSS